MGKPKKVKCMFCDRWFVDDEAATQHEIAKHAEQVADALGLTGDASAVDAATAIEMADSMDLPDGAYFAMIGELMGADGDEAYMVGIEASLASGEYVEKTDA